jgi:beta-xylosidase
MPTPAPVSAVVLLLGLARLARRPTRRRCLGHVVSQPRPAAPLRQVIPLTGVDTFDGTTVKPKWEWNHNPDNGKWSVNNGLTLRTATVTDDLYWARNTLTHRIRGPTSTATIQLDYATMRDGDRAGLALLRDSSAWIGIKRDGGTTRAVMVNGLIMDSNWNTTGTGTEVASANVTGGRIWLRAAADIRPGASRPGTFSYSTDGTNFTCLGPRSPWATPGSSSSATASPFQLRHADTRRFRPHRTVRTDHTPSTATSLPRI